MHEVTIYFKDNDCINLFCDDIQINNGMLVIFMEHGQKVAGYPIGTIESFEFNKNEDDDNEL